MGKVREPKVLAIDECFVGTPEVETLLAQGHEVKWIPTIGIDMIISPKAQMTPPGRLAYVVKKLKEIVKEVAK